MTFSNHSCFPIHGKLSTDLSQATKIWSSPHHEQGGVRPFHGGPRRPNFPPWPSWPTLPTSPGVLLCLADTERLWRGGSLERLLHQPDRPASQGGLTNSFKWQWHHNPKNPKKGTKRNMFILWVVKTSNSDLTWANGGEKENCLIVSPIWETMMDHSCAGDPEHKVSCACR